MHVVQSVARGASLEGKEALQKDLDVSGCVLSTFLGVFASFVVLSEVWITGLHCDDGRLDDGWWRDESRLAWKNAGISLALCDEGPGTFLGDDLKVVRSTGVGDVDRGRRPVSEDDGPLFLPHGDVLGVVVPVIAEGMELSLEFVGDGKDEGVVGRRVVVLGTEEGERFSFEEILDFAPDERGDGCIEGHSVMRREKWVRL